MFNEYLRWFFNTSIFSNNNYIIIIRQANIAYEFSYKL